MQKQKQVWKIFQYMQEAEKQEDIPLYWLSIKESSGNQFILTDLSEKNESLHICRDTIKRNFRDDTTIIAFEMIHHLATNEIQYIWLDEKNIKFIPFIRVITDKKPAYGQRNQPATNVSWAEKCVIEFTEQHIVGQINKLDFTGQNIYVGKQS